MKRSVLVVVALSVAVVLGVGSAAVAFGWRTSDNSHNVSVAYDAAYEASYEKMHNNAYRRAFDAAYKPALRAVREREHAKAYDAAYEEAFRLNYVAAYAREAIAFQCEGVVPETDPDGTCSAQAWAQASRAYEALGR